MLLPNSLRPLHISTVFLQSLVYFTPQNVNNTTFLIFETLLSFHLSAISSPGSEIFSIILANHIPPLHASQIIFQTTCLLKRFCKKLF